MKRATKTALGWMLTLAGATAAQAQPAPAAATVPADGAPVNDQAAQDRIMALVSSGKCGPAKAEAVRVGDTSLAEQIGTMCGAHSSNPFPQKGGGGRGGGGGGSHGGAAGAGGRSSPGGL